MSSERLAPARLEARPAPMRMAGLLWLLAGTFYLTCETITALAYPGYSYAHNYISDLGVPVAGVIGGRAVYSPLAGLMNVGGFMADGMLFLAATLVAARASDAQRSAVGRVLAALGVAHGIGTVVVGALPEGTVAGASGIPPLHVIGAARSICGGNLGLVFAGVVGRRFGADHRWCGASLALGAFGLACVVLLEASRLGWLVGASEGLLERGSVYPITVWELITGVSCLIAARVRTA